MILLFSGGVDSFVAYHYLKRYTGVPDTLYFDLNTLYSKREKNTVAKLIPSTIIETCIDFKEREEPVSGFVPYRNLHLALLANRYSDTIVIAGLKDDMVNDKNEEVFVKFSSLMSSMTGRRIQVISPFWGMTKAQVVSWYLNVHKGSEASLLRTFSCYSKEDTNYCGKCPACFRKWCAFFVNNIPLDFYNEELMNKYYAKALVGNHYDPDRNESIITAVQKYREWKGK
jgi:7-cyano-7-deazaguanine synthase in queuosine biosynthesis